MILTLTLACRLAADQVRPVDKQGHSDQINLVYATSAGSNLLALLLGFNKGKPLAMASAFVRGPRSRMITVGSLLGEATAKVEEAAKPRTAVVIARLKIIV